MNQDLIQSILILILVVISWRHDFKISEIKLKQAEKFRYLLDQNFQIEKDTREKGEDISERESLIEGGLG